jgi:hypothetical protein
MVMQGYIQNGWWHKFQSPDNRSSTECMVEIMTSIGIQSRGKLIL